MSFNGYTLPAPGGGLNLIDGNIVGDISELEAVELENLYPKSRNKIEIRGGVEDYCDTTETADIEGLYTLNKANGDSVFIAATNNKLYDVSTSTPSDITGTTTPTSDEWVGTTFNHRLFLANGADTVQVSTGSTFADSTFSGVTLSSLIAPHSYKQRVYFIESGTGSVWYGASQAISGALTEFDFSYFLKRGGNLIAGGSFTDAQGVTNADLYYVCSSEGEILFYSGSSPADNAWTLVARFVIGKPLGKRAFIRVDNDVWVITEQGIVPLSALFSGTPTTALNSIGRSINKRIQDYASQGVSAHRWTGVFWPKGKRVYIVIPISTISSRMLVCNTETRAWCDYTFTTQGIALALGLYDGIPYVGDNDGNVRKFEQNKNDDTETISYKMVLPFNFYGSRTNYKAFKEIRPLMRTIGTINLNIAMDTDFTESSISSTIATSTGSTTPWGSPWGSPWGQGAKYQYERYSLQAQGHSGALRISGSIKDAPLEFNAFEIRFKLGGQI